MFPLSNVLFPCGELPLHVFEPRYQALTNDCLAGDGEFGVVLIERGSEVGGGDLRCRVGSVAHIEIASPLEDGRWVLVTRGTERFKVLAWLPDDPYPVAMVEPHPSAPYRGTRELLDTAENSVRRTCALLSELGDAPAFEAATDFGDNDEALAWSLCARAPVNVFDAQRMLETDDPVRRLELLVELSDALAEDLALLLAGGLG
jgi:Lon protease-like protein